jgi:Spy/CpxP family protein refolding chaperone
MKPTLALFAVLGLLPMAQAQTPPPHTPPPPAPIPPRQRYTTLLTLNANQVEQATTIFTTEATTEQNSRASERAAHQTLENAIKSGDTAAIQTTATTLGQMSGEMMAAHALARSQFYALLTADQKTKYSQLEQEHMMGGPGHGPFMR